MPASSTLIIFVASWWPGALGRLALLALDGDRLGYSSSTVQLKLRHVSQNPGFRPRGVEGEAYVGLFTPLFPQSLQDRLKFVPAPYLGKLKDLTPLAGVASRKVFLGELKRLLKK